jgi:hypothetical protein
MVETHAPSHMIRKSRYRNALKMRFRKNTDSANRGLVYTESPIPTFLELAGESLRFLLGRHIVLQGKFHAKDLGGYAIFGAIYFLIAGILLSRKLSKATAAVSNR